MPEWDIIPPPASMTVDHEHKPRLYTVDGKALVRQAGFTAGGRHVVPEMSQAPSEVPRARREGEK